MKLPVIGACSQLLLLACMVWALPVAATPPTAQSSMHMEKAARSLLLDITLAGDRLVAVGERGHILYSDDSAVSWTQASVPTTAMLTRVFFVSDSLGWAVGHDGNILVSRNGGINWELQRDGVSAQASINTVRAERAKSHLLALERELSKLESPQRAEKQAEVEAATNTLNRALGELEQNIFPPPLMGIWFSDELRGWAAGAYGTLLHTSNGGQLWEDWSDKVDNPEQLHFNGVIGTSGGTVLLASEWGTVFRSSTGGESWHVINTGYEGSFFGLIANPATGSIMAYGLRGTLYRSKDSGSHWEPLKSGVNASLFGACSTPGGAVSFVGAGGAVIQSLDDGDNFNILAQNTGIGAYGITALKDGTYVLTGEGGSKILKRNQGMTTGVSGSQLESK